MRRHLLPPRLVEARELADGRRPQAAQTGQDVWISAPWDPGRSTERLHETDLLICLGGDGTILRAARASVGHRCLILGVDLGRQAFLTELRPRADRSAHSRPAERRLCDRRSHHARSAPIGVEADAPGLLPALNDVMIGRGSLGQPAYVAVWVGGDLVGVVRADAVVVASATGSTGYSLSAGGRSSIRKRATWCSHRSRRTSPRPRRWCCPATP